VNILVNWYSKCSACDRWNGVFSASLSVIAEVRQGGILSPVLFAIYIDDIVNQLAKMNYGCMIGGQYIGCILYADDIILLSQSVTCVQLMINVACSIVDDLDLLFNVTKSAVIRIGSRFRNVRAVFVINGKELIYVKELKYLGVFITAGRKFKLSYSQSKFKFYRCFNAIYSKSKCASSELVTVNLLKSFCLPIIFYGTEAINPNKSDMRMLDNLINVAICKIFSTYNREVVCDIRSGLALPNLEETVGFRSVNFLNKFYAKNLKFSSIILALNVSLNLYVN
jgi:hypothetical protein